jgi:hypothetical protein
MNIHHITALDNVVNGRMVDPKKTKHGVIMARKIADLSGWIDPMTHLNLDFSEHLMRYAIVAEKLETGSAILFDEDNYLVAGIDPSTVSHYGQVCLVAGKGAILRSNTETVKNDKLPL